MQPHSPPPSGGTSCGAYADALDGAARLRTQVALGNCHGAALGADGVVWTWGAGIFGELGHGSLLDSAIPRRLSIKGERVVQIGCGFYHTAAVAESGSVYAWGWNRDGQLGFAGASSSPKLVTAMAAHRAAAVSCGHFATAVLTRAGDVVLMGSLVPASEASSAAMITTQARASRARRSHCARFVALAPTLVGASRFFPRSAMRSP